MATAPNVQNLPIEQIDPSPDNPRLAFGGDLGDLTELTESIRAQGVLQHLVICPEAEGRYQLVFGHRRLAAAQAAGLTEVPAEIRDYDATERFAAMYGENFGREGLTPLQEAWAYQQALNRKGPGGKKLFTQRNLAERLGVSQAKISKYTGIFKLPEHVVAMLTGGELTITEAIHLVLLAKDPARVEAALGDFRQHHDMELAVRTQQSDIERQARVAKTLADLKKQRVRVAPDDWREQGGKKLGDGYYDLHQTPEEHVGEPCHAAMVTHHGDVAWVCTDPDRHRPPEPEPAGPPAAADGTAVAEDADVQDAGTGRVAAGSDVDLPARPATDAAPGSVGEGEPALAVDPAPAAPDPEELAVKARMEQARKAAEEERRQREQAAQEREANVTAAYEARTAALRTLLAGRLSRPEVTRLLASFLVRLAFRDYYYDDGFLRHALSLDETAAAGEESPVLAFAARNEDGLLRAAVAVVAENAEDALAAGEELDFADPVFRLYLDFLTTVAAYRPTEFEQAEFEAAAGGDEATAAPEEGTDDGEEAAAEEPAGVT
jgi:ParB/RepB/Spo0J family partition protein